MQRGGLGGRRQVGGTLHRFPNEPGIRSTRRPVTLTGMENDLDPVLASLATLNEYELQMVKSSVRGSRRVAPAFVYWLEQTAEWEIERRVGMRPRAVPVAAIPHRQVVDSMIAAMALRRRFGHAPNLAAVFDAVVRELMSRPH